MAASASASARHETRALLRAHLSAATSYRHLTRHCPICHRLLRLALASTPQAVQPPQDAVEDEEPLPGMTIGATQQPPRDGTVERMPPLAHTDGPQQVPRHVTGVTG
ncbi:DUF6274 family protein [Streptomyces sp. NPDC001978]|uniref:DUF6274 family protein n=1 Tax=unclassified Streptomyces TaxID=2593676 RepID=UPI003695D92A